MRENQNETIAVTGSTGFIGRALVRQLASRGYRVRTLVRPRKRKELPPSGEGVEVVSGDLQDEGALGSLVHGVRAVIHCAGMVRDGSGAFQATNVEGTRRLTRAIVRSGAAPHLLALSSLAAREPQLSAYAASKRAGETALVEEAAGVPWTILRPPAVYGPGDRELLPLFQWMMRGIAPILGSPEARFSLIFVEDLAECLVSLIGEGGVSGATYELHDGTRNGYGWDDVGAAVTLLSGKRQLRLPIPAPLATCLAATNFAAQRLMSGAPMFTPGKVRELRHPDWVCDDRPLLAATNWRPGVQLEEGLRRTLFPPASTGVPASTQQEG